MALSGSQLTRIGAFFSGIAKKLSILAKSESEIVADEVAASSQFRIDFPTQDRNIVFAFEDRTIRLTPENRKTKI